MAHGQIVFDTLVARLKRPFCNSSDENWEVGNDEI